MRTTASQVAWGIALVLGVTSGLLTSCGDDESTGAADVAADDPDLGGPDLTQDTSPPTDTGPSDSQGDGAVNGVQCGTATCETLELVTRVGTVEVPACCVLDEPNTCGLDSTILSQLDLAFDEVCQEPGQPGDRDSECPTSPEIDVPGLGGLTFAGCCRPEGVCGYLVNRVESLDLTINFGCLESPFPDDEPPSCTPGPGGEPDVGPDAGDVGGDLGGDVSTDLGGEDAAGDLHD